MKTIASKVKTIIDSQCPNTFSLYAGYGMAGGEYVRFPKGVQIAEKRNENGRVTKAAYKYADDSILEFTWSEPRGARLTVKT